MIRVEMKLESLRVLRTLNDSSNVKMHFADDNILQTQYYV